MRDVDVDRVSGYAGWGIVACTPLLGDVALRGGFGAAVEARTQGGQGAERGDDPEGEWPRQLVGGEDDHGR